MNIKLKSFNVLNTDSVKAINYVNKSNSKASFKDCLNSKNNNMSERDIKQYFIDDEKLYDKYCKKLGLNNIEYGSKAWDEYKEGIAEFPPLTAPVAVKEAWNKVKESIPKDDEEAQTALFSEQAILMLKASYPENFGLPADFQLNTVADYEMLFDNDLKTNEELRDILKDTDGWKQTRYIDMIKDVEDKLKEELLKY
ncbi:hypothetical protein [Clostridium saccharobutylicum]|uniref:Uncharacterized protein n=1 Tax=Clostridium saccharobutylicum TaxID=169679 RepID=A0A1S8N5X0_CLOSA|nr:hypothetical protein [Clostridium saccharobutylicum]OOM11778.1 hypothetical protein CLOSAC_22050 [Clostridium saccharobutylicum]